MDGDIRKCFDQISHDALLAKLDIFPTMNRQVRAWLKAKVVMQDETIFPEKGMPQGGVLSPLLANIALDGIEELLSNWIAEIPAFSPGGHRISKPNVVKGYSSLGMRMTSSSFILTKKLSNLRKVSLKNS